MEEGRESENLDGGKEEGKIREEKRLEGDWGGKKGRRMRENLDEGKEEGRREKTGEKK